LKGYAEEGRQLAVSDAFELETKTKITNIENMLTNMKNVLEILLKKYAEPEEEADEFYTRQELVEIFKISPSTVNRRVADGSIKKSLALGKRSPRYRIIKPL
jgi:Fic family protein